MTLQRILGIIGVVYMMLWLLYFAGIVFDTVSSNQVDYVRCLERATDASTCR